MVQIRTLVGVGEAILLVLVALLFDLQTAAVVGHLPCGIRRLPSDR